MSAAGWRAAVTVALVFLAGAAVGAVGTGLWIQRSLVRLLDGSPDEARVRALVFRLDRELDLTPSQEEEIRAILLAHQPALRELRRAVQPALAAERGRQWEEIRRALDPAQRQPFERLVADLEARAARDLARQPPPAR